jgi:hypothetical protein
MLSQTIFILLSHFLNYYHQFLPSLYPKQIDWFSERLAFSYPVFISLFAFGAIRPQQFTLSNLYENDLPNCYRWVSFPGMFLGTYHPPTITMTFFCGKWWKLNIVYIFNNYIRTSVGSRHLYFKISILRAKIFLWDMGYFAQYLPIPLLFSNNMFQTIIILCNGRYFLFYVFSASDKEERLIKKKIVWFPSIFTFFFVHYVMISLLAIGTYKEIPLLL